MVHSSGNQPPFLGAFQKPPTDRNLGVTERDLIWILRPRFCLYGSGAFSEMRTQEQLFGQKMLHCFYHLGHFKDLQSCEPGMKDEDQMYISYYKSQHQEYKKQNKKSQHHSGEIWSNWRQPSAWWVNWSKWATWSLSCLFIFFNPDGATGFTKVGPVWMGGRNSWIPLHRVYIQASLLGSTLMDWHRSQEVQSCGR